MTPEGHLRQITARLDRVDQMFTDMMIFATEDMEARQIRLAVMRREALFRSLVDWLRKADPIQAVKNWIKDEHPSKEEAKETIERSQSSIWQKVKDGIASLKNLGIAKLPMALVKAFKRMSGGERKRLLERFKQYQERKDWKGAFEMLKNMVGYNKGGRTADTVVIFMDIEFMEVWETDNHRLWVKVMAFLVNLIVNILWYWTFFALLGLLTD